MFVLKDKKTGEILMIASHKDTCRYFSVEREYWKTLTEETDKEIKELKTKALSRGSKDKAYKQECEHLYEILEVPHYDSCSVRYCYKNFLKKKEKTS